MNATVGRVGELFATGSKKQKKKKKREQFVHIPLSVSSRLLQVNGIRKRENTLGYIGH